jgi:hypothetical protein
MELLIQPIVNAIWFVVGIGILIAFALSPFTFGLSVKESLERWRLNKRLAEQWGDAAAIPATEQHRLFAEHLRRRGYAPVVCGTGQPGVWVKSLVKAKEIQASSPVPATVNKTHGFSVDYIVASEAPATLEDRFEWDDPKKIIDDYIPWVVDAMKRDDKTAVAEYERIIERARALQR